MNSKIIYRTALSQAVKDATYETEYSASTAPEFAEFLLDVQETHHAYFGEIIDERKLKALWYGAKYFQSHWRTPTRRSDRSMLWSAFNFGLDYNAGISLYLAWLTKHDRSLNQAEWNAWKIRVLDPVWKDAQPRIKEHERKEMEKQRNKLRNRILNALKDGRSTTDTLAKRLGVSNHAVDRHLYSMAGSKDQTTKGTGEVVRVGWGLYELK